MFVQQPKSSDQLAFDVSSYQCHFQVKLDKLHDHVETNLAETLTHQYDQHSTTQTFLKLVIWFGCVFQFLAGLILGGRSLP